MNEEQKKAYKELCESHGKRVGRYVLMKEWDITESEARAFLNCVKLTETDGEIIAENVRLAKVKQKLQDKQRIERKSFREYARIENAVSALNEKFINLLEKNSFNSFNGKIYEINGTNYGMVQCSDWHINELVNLDCNTYDISIASKRIKKYVSKTIKRFKNNGVGNVLVALTGDLINSDRRNDEKLNQATNRTRAMFCCIELLKQAIEELSTHFNLHIASVAGNESRVNKDWEWSDVCVTDNYDYTIHNTLRYLFKDNKRVEFCGDCEIKKVINFGGKNILLVHGTNIAQKPDNAITRFITLHAKKGVIIDYVVFGHVHMAFASELFSRSGSPVGANSYSEDGLLLTSCASQTNYLINEDGIEACIVNLQNVDNIEGYDLHETLMEYNAKSADKSRSTTTVFKVVI